MMRFMRKKEGFTLMELLIVILTGSIVTMAATTVLLLAFRINHKSLDTIKRQSVTRIMLSVLEDMSSDGEYELKNNYIQEDAVTFTPVYDGDRQRRIWSIIKRNELNPNQSTPVISYIPSEHTGTTGKIVSGNGQGESGLTLVDDIENSMLYKPYSPFDYVKDVYTFSVEIEGETYSSTVYSRTQEDNWYANDPLIDYENARKVLMEVVSYELGSSGLLRDAPNTTYAKWYSNNYGHWDATQLAQVETNAWCGCFVSWALNKVNLVNDSILENRDMTYISPVPQEANVNFLWLECFAQSGANSLHVYGDGYVPQPGDLIFFTDVREHGTEDLDELKTLGTELEGLTGTEIMDEVQHEKDGDYIHIGHLTLLDHVLLPTPDVCWITKTLYDNPLTDKSLYEEYRVFKHLINVTGDGLDHVGIVVKVKDGYVYTVEGNVRIGTEASKVVMRKYPLVNPTDEQIGNIILTSEPLRIFGYATLNWVGNP